MTQLQRLLLEANRTCMQLNNRFDRLHNGHESFTSALQDDIQHRLSELNVACDRLELLVHKEPPATRHREHTRVQQAVHDVQRLQTSYDNYVNRRDQMAREAEEREQLLMNTNFSANTETSILMDEAMQRENNGLQDANRGLDELLGAGSNILSDLVLQKRTLKGAQRRVLDIASTLGLSQSVMRLIDRRQDVDKLILVGGIIVTLLVMKYRLLGIIQPQRSSAFSSGSSPRNYKHDFVTPKARTGSN
eukprot:CFRG2534T1